MPRRAAIVLPHPIALLLVLLAVTAPQVPEAEAIATLPDAGWWSSYAERPFYWVPERVQAWNGQPVAWSWWGGPHGDQGGNLNRLLKECVATRPQDSKNILEKKANIIGAKMMQKTNTTD